MERKISPRIIGLTLSLMIFLAFGNVVSAFNIGDTVEVQNTGEIGLNARDSPAGDPTGWRKFDGDVGVILEGPQAAAVEGITYTWWKIRWSDDLEGWSAEGYPEGVYYLKVIAIPSPPTLVSPSNGATGESLTPTFQWNSVSNANYYGLYISKPPYGPSNLVFDSEVDYGPIYGTSFTLPSGILNNGVKYYWNMRSHNSAGWGQQFSSSWYFITEDTPTPTTTTSTTTLPTSSTTTTTTSTTTTTTVSGKTTTTTTTTSTTISTTTTTSFTTTTTLNLSPNSPQTELITVNIDDQSAIPKEIKVGESVALKFSFTNTGNIPWTFYAAVSLRKPNGDEENLPTKPVTLSPNQQGSVEWTYTVDTVGNWDVVFGVWKEAEQENSLGHTGWLDGYIKGITPVLQADYPGAELIPTDNKFTRDTREIRYIVIHYMDGTLEDTIDWFKRPESEVSAHYLVGKNGRIVQMVKEKDIAWHAGDFNEYSIGIEHEDRRGGLTDPNWATEEMYQSSAALVRYLSEKYDIPKDRTHIVGHSEISKSGKQDPGPYWDWDYYMQLVKGETRDTTPPTISTPQKYKLSPELEEIVFDAITYVEVENRNVNTWWENPNEKGSYGPAQIRKIAVDDANLPFRDIEPKFDFERVIQNEQEYRRFVLTYSGIILRDYLKIDPQTATLKDLKHVILAWTNPSYYKGYYTGEKPPLDDYQKRLERLDKFLSYKLTLPTTSTLMPTEIQPKETSQPEKPEQVPAQPATPAMNEIEKAIQPVIETVQDIIDKIRSLFGL